MVADLKNPSGEGWLDDRPLSVEGDLAKSLYMLLLSGGMQDDCGMGSCGLEASLIRAQREWWWGTPYAKACVTTDKQHVKSGHMDFVVPCLMPPTPGI